MVIYHLEVSDLQILRNEVFPPYFLKMITREKVINKSGESSRDEQHKFCPSTQAN